MERVVIWLKLAIFLIVLLLVNGIIIYLAILGVRRINRYFTGRERQCRDR